MDDVTLNRAIAEALGYTLREQAGSNKGIWDIYQRGNYEGLVCFGDTEAAAWAEAFEDKPDYGSELPRWAQDEGAALRLCLEIGKPRGWLITITCDGSWCAFVKNQPMGFGLHGDQPVKVNDVPLTSEGDTPARALALLALRALGGERDGGNDGTP